MAKLQCVRCTVQRGDVERAHMFLCEPCRAQHQEIAFREAPPVFDLEVVDGRCEFCDQEGHLHYYQWLLCRICANVVGSYRKGKVSALFVLAELNRVVAPSVPGLTFREVDPVVVKPHQQKRGVRATQLDIEGVRDEQPMFWVEVKTGPGAVGDGGMAEFQLDCQDCDDIINTVVLSKLPALLVHCQITKSVQPPTMRIVGEKVWWTDLWAFGESFKAVFERRGEARKLAASFDTKCFKELPALVEAIQEGWIETARARLADAPPFLYHPSEEQEEAALKRSRRRLPRPRRGR